MHECMYVLMQTDMCSAVVYDVHTSYDLATIHLSNYHDRMIES
jgi:hypothetical protein